MTDKTNIEFRIIAGSLKGKVIKTLDSGVTRPPLSRLRKAIFDFLNPYLEQSSYLDLFSGTGSYLFEAASRGAVLAYGIEIEMKLVSSINRQAEKLGIAEKLKCSCKDVFEAIPQLKYQKKMFDIIMLAPPQYKGLIDKTLFLLKKNILIKKDGLILCQHDTSETKKIDFSDYNIYQQRKYGNTTFTILTWKLD